MREELIFNKINHRWSCAILGFDWKSQFSLSVLKSLDHSNLNVESGLGLGRLYQTWLATRSPDAGGDKDPTFQVLIFFLQKIRPFAKLLPLGIETGCGENPMDINPFLGRWKDLVPLTRSGRRKRRKVKKKRWQRVRRNIKDLFGNSPNENLFQGVENMACPRMFIPSNLIIMICHILLIYRIHSFARKKAEHKHLTLCHD